MRARRPLPLALVGAVALVALVEGCQAVLGLDEGQPRDDGAGGGATSSTSCSAGGGASATSSSSGSSSATTSTSSSAGSTSSTSGPGGNGGAGGASSSSSTGGGGPTCTDGTQNGSETGVDCGGPDCAPCPTVLLLATGAASVVVTGEYHPGGTWLTTMIPATTTEAPGLAFTAAGKGVGLIRKVTSDDVEAVSWSIGVWGAFAAIGGAAKTRGRPAVVSVDSTAQAVFHRTDFKHDYAAWTGSQWSPNNEPVGGAANQSFGPSAPDLAVIGADATAVFFDGQNVTNHLTVQDRKAGVWQSKIDLFASAPSANFAISPSIAAVTGGPDLLVLYVRSTDKQVLWLARTAGSWSSMAMPIASALTNDRVALTSLAGGGAMLAFRGTDNKLYTSRFTAGAWSAPIKAAGDTILASTPALARGVGEADAELCFVNTGNVVYHARSLNNAWTTPVQAGTAPGISQVAIAAHP